MPVWVRCQCRGSRYFSSRAWAIFARPASVERPIAAANSARQNSATSGAPSPASGSGQSPPRVAQVAASWIDSGGCCSAHVTAATSRSASARSAATRESRAKRQHRALGVQLVPGRRHTLDPTSDHRQFLIENPQSTQGIRHFVQGSSGFETGAGAPSSTTDMVLAPRAAPGHRPAASRARPRDVASKPRGRTEQGLLLPHPDEARRGVELRRVVVGRDLDPGDAIARSRKQRGRGRVGWRRPGASRRGRRTGPRARGRPRWVRRSRTREPDRSRPSRHACRRPRGRPRPRAASLASRAGWRGRPRCSTTRAERCVRRSSRSPSIARRVAMSAMDSSLGR